MEIYDRRVYNTAVRELNDVDWFGCPYDICEEMVKLMLRYFPDSSVEETCHDVNWAVANELGGGCELESY